MRALGLKGKIMVSTVACILLVGFFSYTFLYRYLANVISERTERVESITLDTLQRRIDIGLEQFFKLGNLAACDYTISKSFSHADADTNTMEAKRDLLRAQAALSSYLNPSSVKPYVNKLMVFNTGGMMIQALTPFYSTMADGEAVRQLAMFQQLKESDANFLVQESPSIIFRNGNSISMLRQVEFYERSTREAWLYAELSPRFFSDILLPYEGSGILVSSSTQAKPIAFTSDLPSSIFDQLPAPPLENRSVQLEHQIFRVSSAPLSYGKLTLYSCSDITFFAKDNYTIAITAGVVSLTSILAVTLLSLLLAVFITRPLNHLTARIKRISDENDFSFDPIIEKGTDEIAQMGRVVNEMTVSITHLLSETESMYEQRKNNEIALLQSQINPHFLYNTLDSIRWMAIIQNNPAIAKTVSSLSNLLKNTAKSVGDKIPLKEELALLQDYVDTQTLRFMETFELVNDIPEKYLASRIIKFTLQPLVENAIFHGIETSGRYGTITLDATEEDGDLLITILDNGVGMTEDELQNLQKNTKDPHPAGMSGIGVANVHQRLKLTYGAKYGLSFTSVKGEYTCAIVRIPMEE